MTTVYVVTRDTPDGAIVCHFGPTTAFPSRTEALLAMFSYTPATPDYTVQPWDDTVPIPAHPLPPTPRMPS